MEQNIKTLIDTVMETCMTTSWMLGDDMKEQFYLKHAECEFEPTLGLLRPNIQLNNEVSLIMFWETWNTGYYNELCDIEDVMEYLTETWHILDL
jgi:hypothetical protein